MFGFSAVALNEFSDNIFILKGLEISYEKDREIL